MDKSLILRSFKTVNEYELDVNHNKISDFYRACYGDKSIFIYKLGDNFSRLNNTYQLICRNFKPSFSDCVYIPKDDFYTAKQSSDFNVIVEFYYTACSELFTRSILFNDKLTIQEIIDRLKDYQLLNKVE